MNRIFYRILSFLLFSVIFISCIQGQHTTAERNQSPERLPTSILENFSTLDQGLLQKSAILRTNSSTLADVKMTLFNHFVASSYQILERKDSNTDDQKLKKIISMYDVFKILSTHPNFQFWIENQNQDVNLAFQEIDHLRSSIKNNNSSENQLLKLYAMVSYLRLIANKISLSLEQLQTEYPQDSKIAEMIKFYRPIPGQIAALSLQLGQKNGVEAVLTKIQILLDSKEWKKLSQFTSATYFKIQDSNDILGLSNQLDKLIFLKAGPKALEILFLEMKKNKVTAKLNSSLKENLNSFPVVDLYQPLFETKESFQFKKGARNLASTKKVYPSLVLIGKIPGQYLNKNKDQFYLGFVEIQNRRIVGLEALEETDIPSFQEKKSASSPVLVLKNKDDYDAIYPGLIDLHDHTKQNNLPVWGQAHGQFANRFEWRDWNSYTKSVSQNMNPWIEYGKPIDCAAFRWSEMQAMVVGTTYLQGPSTCVENFGISQVEDRDSYVSQKDAVQAPTDVVTPLEFQFVWKTLKPLIESGKTYEQAIASVVRTYCPTLTGITEQNVLTTEGLKIFQDQKKLQENCKSQTEKPLPDKFIRYMYWIHPTIAGKINYLKKPNHSAVIAHLAEGRRTDFYNMKEYELVKLVGLNLPNMNFVHGVGIESKNFIEMKEKKMGLIWSPFSNLILYGQTLDINNAFDAGVPIAIGSDWLPTGSKGPLEEIKLAVNYVKDQKIDNHFTDEELYKMMTENPARLINHWDISETESGIGQIAKGAMGTVIVTSVFDPNPFSNLVRKINEENINLVVMDGQVQYGNENYFQQLGIRGYEKISDIDKTFSVEDFSAFQKEDIELKSKEEKLLKLQNLATAVKSQVFKVETFCHFQSPKVFAYQLTEDKDLMAFGEKTRMNLDRFEDIQKLLAVNMMTQSLNRNFKKGDPAFAVTLFPSLYTCNDKSHYQRIHGHIQEDGTGQWKTDLDTLSKNGEKLGSGPKKLAELYK